MTYRIEYTQPSEAHLRALSARDRRRVLDAVDRQLRGEPSMPTRNRKLMRPNPLAPWELRIGDLRVYYDVEPEPHPVVLINAIGIKRGNQVFVGGEEIDLK